MSEVLDTLIEMGFTKIQAELAISKCNHPIDVQNAMDWLLEHGTQDATAESAEDPIEPPSSSTCDSPAKPIPETDVVDANHSSIVQEPSSPPVAKSFKCDDCGKLFKSQEDIEYHAAKSGHEHFSESTEEKKPLTEEEKKEQLSKIETKLRQRRLEREEREKLEALDREKTRIRAGKEMLEAKQKHEELEVQRMVEARKREKEEDKRARQRVKDQIEQDKLARKAKLAGNDSNAQDNNVLPAPPPITPTTSKPSPQTTQVHTEVRLQIRLTNGENLKQTFGAKEPLSAVRLFVEMHRTDGKGPFSLMTTFPRKVFSPEDYDKPLDFLGLAPTSVLVVSKS